MLSFSKQSFHWLLSGPWMCKLVHNIFTVKITSEFMFTGHERTCREPWLCIVVLSSF